MPRLSPCAPPAPRSSAIRRAPLAILLTLALAASCSGDEGQEGAARQGGADGAGLAEGAHRGPSELLARGLAPSPSQARPAGGAPTLLARRELELPGRPVGVARVPGAPGGSDLLAVAIETPGQVRLYPLGALGDPERVITLPVGDHPIGPLIAAGPEGPLLIVASMSDRELLVFEPLGKRPAEPRLRLSLPDVPRRLATGPLGPGGETALAVTLGDDALLLVIDGEPLGPFRLPTERSTALHLAGDGSGLWMGSQSPRALLFVSAETLRTASPGEVQPTRRFELDGIPRAFAEADLAGDGRRRIFAAGGDQGLWRLPEPALEGELHALRIPTCVPIGLLAQDLDGDGRDELLLLSGAITSYLVLSEADERGFAVVISTYAGQTPVAFASADLDGNGRPDLVIANRDARAIGLLTGRGVARSGQPPFHVGLSTPAGRTPLDLALVDLNGDGKLEAAAVSGAEGTLQLFERDYHMLRPAARIPVGASPAQVLAGDLDGDGQADLTVLLAPASGARARFFLGDGAGGAAAIEGPGLTVGSSETRLALARLGPGPAGLAAADPVASRLRFWREPLAGGPALELPLSPPPYAIAPWAPRPGAEPLLAVALAGSQSAIAFVALQGDTLVERERVAVAGYPLHLAPGDLDGDGVLDLVVLARTGRGSNSGHLQTLMRRGAEWQTLPPVATGLLSQRLAVGDLDGDGRADVVVASQNRHAVEYFASRELRGTTFLVRQPALGVGLGPMAVVLGDLSDNGWLDVVAANAFSDDLTAIYSVPPPE
jgi:hypothetical protein